MRILVAGLNYAPEPTGIAPYTSALCEGLAARGHDVRVLTTMPHYPEWRVRAGYTGWSRSERIRGVRVQRLRHYVPMRPSGVRRLLSEITFGLRLLGARWGRPDVVVLVSPALFSSAFGHVRSRIAKVPSVVWVQDLYSLGIVETAGEQSGGVVARVITSVEAGVLKGSRAVCVIHDRFAPVVQQLGASADSVQVVRNWTHLPPAEHGSREESRAALGWGPDEVVALHSGAMGRKQDLENVIAAAREAQRQSLPVRFVLMGNGGERTRLETLAADVSTIEFIDPLPGPQYQAALHAADVLVVNEHAGLREMAVPSKLTSYFSSGRPVVAATDSGSVTASEITASGAGLRVPAGRPADLLGAVLRLHADPGWADELGRQGQTYRETVLSADAAIERFERLLLQVSGSARANALRRDNHAPSLLG